jgi:hypothetical protein
VNSQKELAANLAREIQQMFLSEPHRNLIGLDSYVSLFLTPSIRRGLLMINQVNYHAPTESTNALPQTLPNEMTGEVDHQSIYGPAAVEFMTAQLIECVKQTHTHQIQVSIADDESVWKVTIEKVVAKDNSARTN